MELAEPQARLLVGAIVLASSAVMLAALAAPVAAAPGAAIDQYAENAPANLGRPGSGHGGPDGGQGEGGGPPGAPEAGVAPGTGTDAPRAVTAPNADAVAEKAPSPGGVPGIEGGGGSAPVLGYPMTPFLILLAAAFALAVMIFIARLIGRGEPVGPDQPIGSSGRS